MNHKFSTAVVSFLLSWLKAIASWLLRLFHLSGGLQPLSWLADNWLTLLVLLLIIGVTVDILVWMLRWRPHWAWFAKKRIIVNDTAMVAEPDEHLENMFDGADDSVEHSRYVVPKGSIPRRAHIAGQDRLDRSDRQKQSRREKRRRISQNPIDDVFEVGDSVFTDYLEEEDAAFNTGRHRRVRPRSRKGGKTA